MERGMGNVLDFGERPDVLRGLLVAEQFCAQAHFVAVHELREVDAHPAEALVPTSPTSLISIRFRIVGTHPVLTAWPVL